MTIRFLPAFLFLLTHSEAFGAQSPNFSLPLDCKNGPSCFLQNMMDMEPGPARRDPFCGKATYDGHKGTDFRVRNLPEMRKNIAVLSIADGKVLRIRNSATDHLVETQKDFDSVKGVECGNGVVIDHGKIGGARWISQTCHLAKGSVPVKPGQNIKRGDKIGTIGLSGSTQFPHVHVSVHKDGKLLDLLTGNERSKECTPGLTKSLLSKQAVSQIDAMRHPLLLSGFSNQPVTAAQLVKGKITLPKVGSPLVFYAHYMNLKKGDQIKLTIKGPSGVFSKSTTKPLDRPKATYTTFSGRKSGGKIGSTYTGHSELIRDGKVVFASEPVTISF